MDSNPIIHLLTNLVTLNGNFDWHLVSKYLFNTFILQGVLITIILSVLAQLIGSLIGLLLYFLRRSRLWPLKAIGNGYVLLFRGTPLLVQFLFLDALLPVIGLARPLIGIHVFTSLGFTLQLPFDAFMAALAALALNEGAYMAEIVRAGIDSIDTGQLEAAKSLGMTYGLAMRRIVLPQALRVIVPPLGNEFNGMLKNSSLASTIAFTELLAAAQAFATALGAPLELLTVASIWYLAMTSVWGVIQAYLERRLNASNIDPALRERPSWLKRTFGFGGVLGERPTVPGIPAPVPVDHR